MFSGKQKSQLVIQNQSVSTESCGMGLFLKSFNIFNHQNPQSFNIL